MLHLSGACVLPAGPFALKLWGVWPHFMATSTRHVITSTVQLGHLSSLSEVTRSVPIPQYLRSWASSQLQTPDYYGLLGPGCYPMQVHLLMTGSSLHKAMAQDIVRLMQVTGTVGILACLTHCKWRAMIAATAALEH